MSEYERYIGSKEPIGWIESTTDKSLFVIETATVTISGTFTGIPVIKDAPCVLDNQEEKPSHQISYVWDTQKAEKGRFSATFKLHLQGGLVLIRRVSIELKE